MISIREATAADNEGLIALTERCPMLGDISLCYERGPNFFALNELEGENFVVLVAETDDEKKSSKKIIGCIAGAARKAWVNGEKKIIHYASDLKVDPEYRHGGIADLLSEKILSTFASWRSVETPIIMTILTGNKDMEKRSGIRQLPHLDKVGQIRAQSVSFLWKRKAPKLGGGLSDLAVSHATEEDVPQMMRLWQEIASQRQFAPDIDEKSFLAWIKRAPGLSIKDYYVAKDADQKIVGFFGLWDQDVFKKCRVLGYGKKMAKIRIAYNIMLAMMGAPKLPAAGGHFRSLTALHICVPASQPEILRTLTIAAYNEKRAGKYAFMTFGLDVKDPLIAALDGLMAQPTNVGAYVTTPALKYMGADLTGLPLHFEIALV